MSLLILFAGTGSARGNMILDWNGHAAHAIVVVGGQVPPLGLVDLAIVHTAVYDAVNAIEGYPFAPYAVAPNVSYPASPEAATAAAARGTLVALFPEQRVDLDTKYADSLAVIPDGPAKTNGLAVGRQVAAAILDLRAKDGRNAGTPWDPPLPGPGVYEPTPPGYLPPQAPWARDIMPWTMTSPSQFRVPPPPALHSRTWRRDYRETMALGSATSTERTPEQTDLGRFISDQPMLQWNRAWRGIAERQGLSLLEGARFFAMLATACSDALIACWDSKYFYAFWRPVTAIRAGGGHPRLPADPDWIGLVVTPNHPEYPATHGCFSAASTETLAFFFGTDELEFEMDSNVPDLMNPVRYYTRFSQALQEILDARIYGGMHYRNSNHRGAEIGHQVSRQLVENFFLPAEGR